MSLISDDVTNREISKPISKARIILVSNLDPIFRECSVKRFRSLKRSKYLPCGVRSHTPVERDFIKRPVRTVGILAISIVEISRNVSCETRISKSNELCIKKNVRNICIIIFEKKNANVLLKRCIAGKNTKTRRP